MSPLDDIKATFEKYKKDSQEKMSSISALVLLNEEEIDRMHKSHSQMEEKHNKLNLLVKNRLPTKENQSVDIDKIKKEMELLNSTQMNNYRVMKMLIIDIHKK